VVKGLTRWVRFQPLLAVTLWGGIYPGAKLGLRERPVLSFTSLCLLLAMIILCVVSRRAQPWCFPRVLWKPHLGAGLAQTVFQLSLMAGLQRTTAGHSANLLATAPLLTAGWPAFTRREPLGRRRWVGVVVAFGGVALVVQGGGIEVTGARLVGDLLALGAAGAWAWYGIVIGPRVGTLGALRATGWTMVVAALGFTPLSFAEVRAHPWGSVSWEAWAGLIYGATVGMVLAIALWGRSIHRLGPQQTALYVDLEPVSAVVIAAAVLGEVLRLIQAVGAPLTFVGVGLACAQDQPGDVQGVGRVSPNQGIEPACRTARRMPKPFGGLKIAGRRRWPKRCGRCGPSISVRTSSRIGGFMSFADMDDRRPLTTVTSQRDKTATPASIARGHLAMLVNTEMTHETRA
jgi:drug/metabolite transporter (DMT)-like permease